MLEMLHTFWARNAAVGSTDGNAAQPFFDAFAATVAAAKGTEDATYLVSFLRTAMTSSSTADGDAQDTFAAPAVAYAAAQAALCDGECAAKEASWLAGPCKARAANTRIAAAARLPGAVSVCTGHLLQL